MSGIVRIYQSQLLLRGATGLIRSRSRGAVGWGSQPGVVQAREGDSTHLIPLDDEEQAHTVRVKSLAISNGRCRSVQVHEKFIKGGIQKVDTSMMHEARNSVQYHDMWYDFEALKKGISCMVLTCDLKLNAPNLVGSYEPK
jgi:hypothetical protein